MSPSARIARPSASSCVRTPTHHALPRGSLRAARGALLGIDGRAVLPAAAIRARVPRRLDDLDLGHGPHGPGLGHVGPPSFETPLAAYEEARRESRDRHRAIVVLVRRGHDAIAARHAPASFEAP
jgi:hypothetical protein